MPHHPRFPCASSDFITKVWHATNRVSPVNELAEVAWRVVCERGEVVYLQLKSRWRSQWSSTRNTFACSQFMAFHFIITHFVFVTFAEVHFVFVALGGALQGVSFQLFYFMWMFLVVFVLCLVLFCCCFFSNLFLLAHLPRF